MHLQCPICLSRSNSLLFPTTPSIALTTKPVKNPLRVSTSWLWTIDLSRSFCREVRSLDNVKSLQLIGKLRMDEQMMQAMGLPTGFGQKKKTTTALDKLSKEIKKTMINTTQSNETLKPEKVQQPETIKTVDRKEVEETVSDGEESESDDEFQVDKPPIQLRVALKDHKRTVTSMSLHPTGNKFLTASRDYTVKMWDFHAMSTLLKPFNSFEPAETNPVREIQWAKNGAMFLVATSSSQAKLFDVDGNEAAEFIKGDPYIRDLRQTNGHTGGLTNIKWHPRDESIFMTSSVDSTIRIWSLKSKEKNKDVIFVRSKEKGQKTPVTSCCFSPDGKLICGAGQDGVLRLWNYNGPFINPTMQTIGHKKEPITSVQMSLINSHLVSRSMDGTVKLWDIRKFKDPLSQLEDVGCYYEESNCIYSPNERHILVGSSAPKNDEPGSLLILDPQTLKIQDRLEMPSSVITTMWSASLNQIFLGCSDGSIQVLYEPGKSHQGVLLPLAKAPKSLAVDDYDVLTDALLEVPPDEEAMRLDYRKEKERRQAITDARNRTRPENPYQEKTGKRAATNMAEHVMKSLHKLETRNQDPRAEILKYAKIAEEDPYWIAPAYKNNKHVLADTVYEDESEQKRDEKRRKQ